MYPWPHPPEPESILTFNSLALAIALIKIFLQINSPRGVRNSASIMKLSRKSCMKICCISDDIYLKEPQHTPGTYPICKARKWRGSSRVCSRVCWKTPRIYKFSPPPVCTILRVGPDHSRNHCCVSMMYRPQCCYIWGGRGPVSSRFEQIYVHTNTYSLCTVCIRIHICTYII